MQLSASNHSVDEENFEKLTSAYKACLDESTIKQLGIQPLVSIIEEIKKSFALSTNDARRPASSLKSTILLLAQYGVSGLVWAGTGADETNPDAVTVFVSSPRRIGLPSKERYEDDAVVKKYADVVADVLSQLSSGVDKEVFAGVVELEKKLAAASPSAEERDDVTKYYNPMPVKEASALAPKIGLADIVTSLASGQDIDRLVVMAPNYLKELQTILEETEETVLQSYFIWKTAQSFYPFVDSDVVKPYKRFDPNSEPERWQACVDHVNTSLRWILSRFFVEKAFSAAAKEFGDLIVSDIKDEFIKKLKAAKWVDDQTTEKAIEKVHNIVQMIGYPTKSPNIMDPGSLASYYKTVNISSETYFTNALRMAAFKVSEVWSALGKPVDRDRWPTSITIVDASYSPSENEIIFPAGIMQFPVFGVDMPAYVSYGGFGSVVGHELSHAFDSSGRYFDQNGNYTDWWSDKTVEAFEKRAECFVNQYSNFTVSGPDEKPLHVNGRLTLGENIADAGGLSASFQAWSRRAAEKPNAHLPGLEHFTQSQIFFMSYTNFWCGKTRHDTAIDRIYVDPHAPQWARVLGTMANSREFRESFRCKSKEPTCELW